MGAADHAIGDHHRFGLMLLDKGPDLCVDLWVTRHIWASPPLKDGRHFTFPLYDAYSHQLAGILDVFL